MRKLVLLPVIACISVWAHAQVISVAPAIVSAEGSHFSPDIAAYATVTNNSPATIHLLWSRKTMSAPDQWSSWVCDINACYLPQVNRCPDSQPNVIQPGVSINMDYHVNPDSIEGFGEYVIYLFESSDPETILDSIKYEIHTTTTSVKGVVDSGLGIFPNPTDNYFQLDYGGRIDHITLYGLVGNRVKDFDPRTTSRFDVSDLPQGVYIGRLLSNGQVVKTVRLSKR